MKSSYELAMERLNGSAPVAKLTPEQKKHIAELEAKAKAKIAERELATNADITKAAAAGEFEKVEELRQRLAQERRSVQAELEQKKDMIHSSAAQK
jgi:hypothetical protein